MRLQAICPRTVEVSPLKLGCFARQEFPRTAHVPLGCSQMTDGDAQGETLAEASMREEDVTGFIHPIDERLVLGVELGFGKSAVCGLPPEADDAERNRRETLEIWMRVNP